MGFQKAEDFYIALGQAKISPKSVTSKLMHRLKEGEAAVEPATARRRAARSAGRRPSRPRASSQLRHQGRGRRRRDAAAGQVLPPGARRPDRRLHLARQGHHDPPRGLPQRPGADAQPRALHQGRVGGRRRRRSFRVELQIDGWDRHRLLEDLSRTFAETGINILEARCTVVHPMVKNRFVVEVGDTAGAEDLHHAAAQHRLGLRRLPRHADRLSDGGAVSSSATGTPTTCSTGATGTASWR